MPITISVFTTTYNRVEKLARAFRSLINQTELNFEWVVLDDGSTDGTREKIEEWKASAPFKIVTVSRANKGRTRSLNEAFKLASGTLLYQLDSDDELPPYAISHVTNLWLNLSSEKQDKLIGIIGPHGRGSTGLPMMSRPFDIEGALYVRQRDYRYKGEALLIPRRDLVLNTLYPEIDDEPFITEGLLHNRLFRLGAACVTTKVLDYYHHDISDGDRLSALKVTLSHPVGFSIYSADILNKDLHWLATGNIEPLKAAARLWRHILHNQITVSDGNGLLTSLAARTLFWGAFPLGLVWWGVDTYRLKKQSLQA
jgi:glycosyltransferase involved in cell wall biosynthesis